MTKYNGNNRTCKYTSNITLFCHQIMFTSNLRSLQTEIDSSFLKVLVYILMVPKCSKVLRYGIRNSLKNASEYIDNLQSLTSFDT